MSKSENVFSTKTFMVKSLNLDDKNSDENKAYFSGYASVFNIRDTIGDVVKHNAFKRSIDHHDGKFPLLSLHRNIIGQVSVNEDKKGLYVQGFLDLNVNDARETYSLMKNNIMDGMSFGFEIIKKVYEKFDGLTSRILKELSLKEVTVCPNVWSINPEAGIENVKNNFFGSDTIEMKPGIDDKESWKEIRYRIKNPDDFIDGSFKRKNIQNDPKIIGIFAKLKNGDGSLVLQALRFPKDAGWNVSNTRKWLNDHREDFKSIIENEQNGVVFDLEINDFLLVEDNEIDQKQMHDLKNNIKEFIGILREV